MPTTFTTTRKISHILPHTKTKETQQIYEIPCKSCEGSYLSQTNRIINTRRDEHSNAVRKMESTFVLAEHARKSSHDIDFSNTKLIAIEIERRPNNLNTRDATQRLPPIWRPGLSTITKKTATTASNRRHPSGKSALQTTSNETSPSLSLSFTSLCYAKSVRIQLRPRIIHMT